MDSKAVHPIWIGARRYWRVGPVMFASPVLACTALQAAQTHQLDLLDLVAQFRASVATVQHFRR